MKVKFTVDSGKTLKSMIIMFLFLLTTSLYSSVMTDDLGVSWGMKLKNLSIHLTNQLMKSYTKYDSSTPEEQDLIIKKVRDSMKEMMKNRVFFKSKDAKYDNSIYAGEFNYGNNESLITLIKDKKTIRFFMIKDVLWKVVIIIEADDLGKKYTLSSFINHFSNKYKLKPYKIDYDKFRTDEKIPIKAYFKDNETLLSLAYNDIYGSFILVYSSIKVMKLLKKQGFNVIVKADIELDVDVGDEVREYDQLLYETDYTSDDDDDDTKDVFTEIDKDFKKEEKMSEEKKKARDSKLNKKSK